MSVLARMNEFIKQLENGDDEFFERLNQEFLEFCNQQEKIRAIPEFNQISLSTIVYCKENVLEKKKVAYPQNGNIVSKKYSQLTLTSIKNTIDLEKAA